MRKPCELDPEFVPTCQYAAASTRLMSLLGRIIDLLVYRNDELGNQRAEYDEDVVWFTETDMRRLWSLLETINRHIPVLRNLHHQRGFHPASLHRELASLAGSLCTVSDVDPRDVPAYDHNDPTAPFNPIWVPSG